MMPSSITSLKLAASWLQMYLHLSAIPPWTYFSATLLLGSGIALFQTPQLVFRPASLPFLLILACLQFLFFSNHAHFVFLFTIIPGLLIAIPLCFNQAKNQNTKALASVLLWHRFSDLLLLFSLASWKMHLDSEWCTGLFLLGIFIRISPLMITIPLRLTFSAITPTTQVFYFYTMGISSAALLIKTNLLFSLSPPFIAVFVVLLCLSGIFSLLGIILHADQLSSRMAIGFLWILALHFSILFGLQTVSQILLVSACISFSLLFHNAKGLNSEPFEEKLLWKAMLLSGWRLDSLLETIFLKTVWFFSSFLKEIFSPLIYILWIQIPQTIALFIQISLRMLNAGGTQKAITVVILGLTLFLIYYAGI